MAYNRPYNPDELPRFAEPEPKVGGAPSSARYDSKPTSSLPSERDRRDSGRRQDDRYAYDAGRNGRGPMSPPPNPTGPRPTNHGRPPANSRPPPSPAPETGGDPTMLPLFRAVDKNATGQLSEKELSAALVNGDWTPFDPHTIRMMIRMFDSDRSGTIGFKEFCGLWSFLAEWRKLFDQFDTDRSGSISLDEFTRALVNFGYRLSPKFIETIFYTYDKNKANSLSFDLFVQACISLKRMTDVFKKYDEDRDGYITLSFEDFLFEILKQLK
ncbi:peflin [Microdochium nivale]|nr:peflin [Microdochium nivale]